MALLNFLKTNSRIEDDDRTISTKQGNLNDADKYCPNCNKEFPVSSLLGNDFVCACGYHFRMKARQRIQMITDAGSFHELYSDMKSDNPLDFPGYHDKLETARTASGEQEAVVCGTAAICCQNCCLFVMESSFMMGSMGSTVGEKITSLFEYAVQNRQPVIGFIVSGGARMQEGLLSLMQMAKTSAAVKRHSDAGLLYIAVLTDPTTGGVTASFAMEADIILAEPGATIGFTGARVIEQMTNQSFPDDVQKAESMLKHGFVDCIVPRSNQKGFLAELLKMHDGRAVL